MSDPRQPDFDVVFKTSQLAEAAYVRGLPVWDCKESEANYRERFERASWTGATEMTITP